MEYRSRATLLGIPLLHVAIGSAGTPKVRRVAKGWIAFGDIAFGVLFAAGGIAVGGVSIGGLSIGAVAIAGLAIGVWSAGGLALGVLAVGGAAIGSAALGGLAIARDYAIGGFAVAPHANDEAARVYLASGGFSRLADVVAPYRDWLIALGGIFAFAWLLAPEEDQPTSRRS